jgi:hypothetical protein
MGYTELRCECGSVPHCGGHSLGLHKGQKGSKCLGLAEEAIPDQARRLYIPLASVFLFKTKRSSLLQLAHT